MKKYLVLIACAALLLVSCKEQVDTKRLMEGTWVCADVNNLNIPTDRMLTLDFEHNGIVTLSQGVKRDGSHSEFVSVPLKYQVDDQTFTINGIFIGNDSLNMKFDIVSLTKDKLIANLVNVTNNALVNRPLGKYTFTKVYTPNKHLNAIHGEWEGYRHKAGTDKFDSLATIKMQFTGSRAFVFSKRFNDNWSSCDGTFTLYQDKMAVNYATEVSSYYDCWEIVSVNSTEMMLRKYSADSDTASMVDIIRYKMVKL
ncbi:MAG: hypothetical protein J5719_01960 [Bacteroidales bacterium]|nr:hypothetical protein [Bacteroidales bacterium]